MYIEHLDLPNEDEPTLLEAVQGFADPDLFARAEDISNAVHAVIKPIPNTMPNKVGEFVLSPENIATTGMSSCYGSNLVLSEAFTAANIPHYVGFANDHVFTIVSDMDTNAYYLDAHSPILNVNILPAINPNRFFEIPKAIKQYRRGIIKIDGRHIIDNAEVTNPSERDLFEINAWLTHATRSEKDDPRNLTETTFYTNQWLTASLYEPEVGRFVIKTRSKLYEAIAAGDYYGAADELHKIRGIYPELDARNKDKPKRLGRLALRLAEIGDTGQALKVIDDISASYEQANDIGLDLLPAHQLREISRRVSLPEFAVLAIERYRAVLKKRPGNRVALDGIRAAQKTLQTLSN